MALEHSRALRLAAGVSGLDELTLKERQERALVAVRLDPALAGAALTARVLLSTLRRLPGRLALDRSGLDDETVNDLEQAVDDIDPERPLIVTDGAHPDAVVELDIATAARGNAIRLVPENHGAHVITDAGVTLGDVIAPSALGCVLTAALGAAEAFKHIIVDRPNRRTLHTHLRLCAVTLGDDLTTARAIPDGTRVDAALVGTGAIGTAIALILAELRLGGSLALCDPQRFDRENRGTYSLGGEREARERPYKVDLAGDVLERAGYTVHRVRGKSTDLIQAIDERNIPAPAVILAGLDSPAARRETQTLWPDHILDAATGDTAVGLHHATPNGPCLRCFFPERRDGPDPLFALAAETGLSIERLRRGDDALGADDLDGMTNSQRDRLTRFLGRPVCGLADALGLTDAATDDYLPSVPFVSQTAAALAVGRLLALELRLAPASNFVQFDALHGPQDVGDLRNPAADCFCQTRTAVVRRARERRGYGRSAT